MLSYFTTSILYHNAAGEAVSGFGGAGFAPGVEADAAECNKLFLDRLEVHSTLSQLTEELLLQQALPGSPRGAGCKNIIAL